MPLLKSILFVFCDPIFQILVLSFLIYIFRCPCAFWKVLWVYSILISSSIFYVVIGAVWSVSDTIDNRKSYDVAILLLGVSEYHWHGKYIFDGRNQYCNLNKNGDRVGYIIQQMQDGKVETLLLGHLMIDDFDETACVVDLMRQHGILENRIKIMGGVSRTLDEIDELGKYLSQAGELSVLMVTSEEHMRRAMSMANDQKINLDYFSTGKVVYSTFFDGFIISTKWLSKSKNLFYEMFAYMGYLILGRL